MTSELAVIDAPQQAMVPLSEMERMSEVVAGSGLFGIKDCRQALALMLIAQAEGQHPATIARDYDIIQGRPSKKAEALMRDFIASAGKVEWKQLDDDAADAVFSHPSGGSIQIRWDMDRAIQAGLGGKDMWKKYPRQMLRSRCISEGIRTVCPMVTSGMYVPEEAYDMDPAPPAPPVVSTQTVQSAPVTPTRPKEEARHPAPAPVKEDGSGAIYVSDVQVYEGVGKNDKPYTKYTVTLSDGTAGSTFDAGLGALAQEAQDQVKAVVAEFGPQPSNPSWKPDLKDLQLAMEMSCDAPDDGSPISNPIETTVRKFEQRNASGGVVYAIETDHGRFGTADAQTGTSLSGLEGKLVNIEWRESDRGREVIKVLDLDDTPF